MLWQTALLFIDSSTPRIDTDECALLDASKCRAMLCHAPWYRDLLAKHQGLAKQSEIILWPYPTDPWPCAPLPNEYDLLTSRASSTSPTVLAAASMASASRSF